MKKHLFIGASLALAIAVGSFLPTIIGTTVYADNKAQTQVVKTHMDEPALNDSCDYYEGDCKSNEAYYNGLVKDGILTLKEAEQLINMQSKIDALNREIDTLYEDNQDLMNKATMGVYYKELKDEAVLNDNEIKALKNADEKRAALYDDVDFLKLSEAEYNTLAAKEEAITKSIAPIQEKIDAYYKNYEKLHYDVNSIDEGFFNQNINIDSRYYNQNVAPIAEETTAN